VIAKSDVGLGSVTKKTLILVKVIVSGIEAVNIFVYSDFLLRNNG